VPFAGAVEETFAALARKYRTYIVVTLDLVEADPKLGYTNSAVLLDRAGKVTGIYRKLHPVAELGQDKLEGGISPGNDVPVFNCDFGKLGIQICYDMVYDDGWAALARKGAELVVWPSASPATAQPASRARQHGFYLVSSTYRNNASLFEPTGMIAAQIKAPERVLVQEIDLSYALLPWSGKLRNGQAFRDRYGEKVGFRYYEAEDLGIFWSNDPSTPIREMVRAIGVAEIGPDVERNRLIQNKARNGPLR
jgi:predicted amidohydrolase